MDKEEQVDLVLNAFNSVVSQEYEQMLYEEGIEHDELLFDIYYAGATTGLSFVKEWNDNERKNKNG